MGKVAAPASPQTLTVKIPQFLGADLTNDPGYMSVYRSPDCPNMIRESAGKVRKWIGWHTVKQYPGPVNGFHRYSGPDGDIHLVHAGDKLYIDDEVIYEGMGQGRSVSRQLAGKLIIADGQRLLMFYKEGEETVCCPVDQKAYVPTITISRSPSGGGTTYEAVNLLGSGRKDSFLGNATDREYRLSANRITSVEKVERLLEGGDYEEITRYTTDLTAGKVIFDKAPGESVLTGHDNIIITYHKQVEGYADRINKGDIMTLYGVSGAMDRIFLSGGGENKNRDYYCQMDDATYWGDLWYSVIGSDISSIMGYSIINDKLATHIDRSENDTNIILRSGELTSEGKPSFTLAGSFGGGGAVSKYAFATLETEPLFLTDSGIMAVTVGDVIGERFSQLRSYYLNGLLLKQDLGQAVCAVYDRFYMLAAGGYLFALDGTQSVIEKNMPYSGRQYEGFYRTGVNARCIRNIDGVLTFGTEEGYVRRFYTDYSLPANFNDDGRRIKASWSTPEISGDRFYYKKRFKLLAVMIGSAIATGLRAWADYDGIKEMLMDYDGSARYLSFSNITFSKFSFRTDRTGRIIREKISVKPDDKKARFIFENSVADEPFALYDATIEFTQSR